ncbi:MAG: carbohydrate ABC transporter permease [Caldilineaceae bacterium SB0665_bin_21]|nr:carbohydrate ABC transporter permease [Caldilineaceae bacterium SB0665_bin_21]MYA04219.1 carbohydrate ABC transporter permease [Caldilineaceae bacterium SB0664_bin_22]MYC61734.1 carbohydrate ABC transporter permease [Caldilineaceae bacterium SB0661_bin_34]
MAEQTAAQPFAPVADRVPTRSLSIRGQERLMAGIATAILVLGLTVVLFPLFWMLSTSLKGEIEALKIPPNWIPKSFQWVNYRDALTHNPFGTYFRNTFYFAGMVVIGEVLSNSFIAYGFARLRAPGRNVLFIMVLATLMVPAEVTIIPTYVLFANLPGQWLNTYNPLIIPAWLGSAYLIFLLRQFYLGIPFEYDESARLEGASRFGIWWRIILPLSKPALGAVAIMSFIFHWNTFQGPLIYINDNAKFPVSLGLSMFRTPFGGTPQHWYMAASLAVIAPCIVVFFIAQRYFIQGIVVSGVKG